MPKASTTEYCSFARFELKGHVAAVDFSMRKSLQKSQLENGSVGPSGNDIKRWPGQLSNTLEEVTQAETMRKVESLLEEAEQLKWSLMGERKNTRAGNRTARRPTKQDAGPSGLEPRERKGFDIIVDSIALGIRSCRNFIRQEPWFEDLRELVRVVLWETLSFLHLYTLRDAAMENLGFVTTTGRQGDRATRREEHDGAIGRRGDGMKRQHGAPSLLVL
jgi:hypothetical protein